jgi:MSHA biogenesis protein MshP
MRHSPPSPCWRARRKQRGMSLATAVLLLIMLSGVAAYIVSLSGSQQANAGMDAAGQRAYQAARSGTEYGVWNAIVNSACPASQTLAAGSMAGTLAPYTVTVTCAVTNHTEATTAIASYTLTGTACNRAACPAAAPGANYVERQVSMTAWK